MKYAHDRRHVVYDSSGDDWSIKVVKCGNLLPVSDVICADGFEAEPIQMSPADMRDFASELLRAADAFDVAILAEDKQL